MLNLFKIFLQNKKPDYLKHLKDKEYSLIGKAGSFKLQILSSNLSTLVAPLF